MTDVEMDINCVPGHGIVKKIFSQIIHLVTVYLFQYHRLVLH